MRTLSILFLVCFSTSTSFSQNSEAIEFYNEGVELFKQKKYKQAVEKYSETIDLMPEYINAYYNRGNSYLQLKKYNSAINDFISVTDLEPTHKKGFFYMGYYERTIPQSRRNPMEEKITWID